MVDLQIFGLYTYLAPVEAERHIQGSNVSVCVWLRGGVVCPCVNDSVGVGESGESHIMIIPFKFLTKLDLMFVQVMSYKHHAECGVVQYPAMFPVSSISLIYIAL